MHMPAAMVIPISRIANLPSCGISFTGSITIGFVGLMVTIAASPALMKVGFSSFTCPVFGSSFLSREISWHADLGGVGVENRGVSCSDCGGVLQNDNLSYKLVSNLWWVVNMTTNVSSADIVLADTTDVPADVVSWESLWNFFVVHLNGFNFTGCSTWHEDDLVTLLHDTGFNSAYRHSSDTGDGVCVFDRDPERESWMVFLAL